MGTNNGTQDHHNEAYDAGMERSDQLRAKKGSWRAKSHYEPPIRDKEKVPTLPGGKLDLFCLAQAAARSEMPARVKHADGRTGVIRGNEVVIDGGGREEMIPGEWVVVWGWR